MVKTLRIGPYTLRLVPLHAGPLLEVKGESEALALLLNHAVEPTATELVEAIEAGGYGDDTVVCVSPADDAEEDLRLRDAWADRTGEQLASGEVARVEQAGREDTLAVAWTALRGAFAELREIRAAWRPEPGPWLFARPALRPFVTPEDFQVVKELNDEAAAIDELDLQAVVGRETPELIRRRRAFLAACRGASVFASDEGVRDQWLYNWSADRLLALRRAALRLRAWGLLGEDEEPPGARVCLDYARLELWPPGEDGERWARSALELLKRPPEGEQGAVIERVGNSMIQIWWRRDAEQPALLAVSSSRSKKETV